MLPLFLQQEWTCHEWGKNTFSVILNQPWWIARWLFTCHFWPQVVSFTKTNSRLEANQQSLNPWNNCYDYILHNTFNSFYRKQLEAGQPISGWLSPPNLTLGRFSNLRRSILNGGSSQRRQLSDLQVGSEQCSGYLDTMGEIQLSVQQSTTAYSDFK
jgi:hypothetical protein